MTKKEWQRIFANRVLDRLGELNMTQKELADRILVDKSTISKYLYCERVPDAITLANIALVLDIRSGWLIDVSEIVEKD